MSGLLIVIVIAVLALAVLGIVLASRSPSRQSGDNGQWNGVGTDGGAASTFPGFLASGAQGTSASHDGLAGAGPHAAMDYSTNDFSGPDPASDAGVSFGDCGGGDAGGGGDGGGGGGGD